VPCLTAGRELVAIKETGARRDRTYLSGSGDRSGRRRSKRRRSRRRIRRVSTVMLLGFVLAVGWSIAGALHAPGSDSTAARLAEWGRGHGLGFAVTWLEDAQYSANPPVVGGSPPGGIPRVAWTPPHRVRTSPSPRPTRIGHLPAPLAPQLQPALPGEGQWQTLKSVRGRPAIRAAFLRPDSQHTSYLVGIAQMDQSLVRLVLHPGLNQPGGTGWSQQSQIPANGKDRLLATFNSGFRLADAHGGYWQTGKQLGQLRDGAASLVVLANGRVDIQRWTHGSAVPRGIDAVRQNLDLLVDAGTISSTINSSNTRTWGRTVGNAAYVWRSGLGIRADGSLVSVVGPALSVASLAHLLHAAGAVRAMELDINKDWTSYLTYTRSAAGALVPHPLTNDEHPDPYRYLRPSSRDFLAVYAR
jgi:Phosphodiester glycosidase